MLRLALSIYQTNPTPMDRISEIRLSEDEKDDHAITELIWFQFLAGATPKQIESNLSAYRQMRSDALASYSHREHTLRSFHNSDNKITTLQNYHDVQVPQRHQRPSDVRAYKNESFLGSVATASGHTNFYTSYLSETAPAISINNAIISHPLQVAEEDEGKERKGLVTGIVNDDKVMRFSASVSIETPMENPPTLPTSPRAHFHWRLRNTRHQKRRNTHQ